MLRNYNHIKNKLISALVVTVVCLSVPLKSADATDIGNFGLPGLIDLPTAKALPTDELVITQQLHASLAFWCVFPSTTKIRVAFRYSGHGKHGADEAMGAVKTTIAVLICTLRYGMKVCIDRV